MLTLKLHIFFLELLLIFKRTLTLQNLTAHDSKFKVVTDFRLVTLKVLRVFDLVNKQNLECLREIVTHYNLSF